MQIGSVTDPLGYATYYTGDCRAEHPLGNDNGRSSYYTYDAVGQETSISHQSAPRRCSPTSGPTVANHGTGSDCA